MRIRHISKKVLPVMLTGKIINDPVNIVGNVIVIANRCKFNRGIRITSDSVNGEDFFPKMVELVDCEFPLLTAEYPIKISATKTPDRLIESVLLDRCIAEGNGKPYKADLTGGTPDNIAVHHCEEMELVDCISFNGGENGYSLNASKRIYMTNCSAHGNDGQGLHLGRFGTLTVRQATISNFRSADNMLNKLSVAGVSCGVLMHNVEQAKITALLSIGNVFAASHQLASGTGSLDIDGTAYGVGHRPITATGNVMVSSRLAVASE
jgi:hypothetical protein